MHWHFIRQTLEKDAPPADTRVLFLGESRVNAGIDFNKITGAFNFASGGTTPIESYYILKKYIDRFGAPDTVLLSISPRFLSETFAFFPYAVSSKTINRHDFKEIMNLLGENDTTLGKTPRLKFFLYQLNYFEYYQSDVFYNYVFNGIRKNRALINEISCNKGASPHPGLKDSCSELNYETKYKHFNPAPILDTYFVKLLNLCKDNNIHLIFFFMPFNESSLKASDPVFINEYQAYIQKRSTAFPEFNISDTVYAYPDRYFGDESHLNTKGKERFTEQLQGRYFKMKGAH
jgi:hypothetical protein